MAEVLVEYADIVTGRDGSRYLARACGSETSSGTWQGWLEFVNVDGGVTLRSSRETTQPNRTDTVYWATGLTPIYLEGALERARHPLQAPSARPYTAARFEPPTVPAADFAPEAAPADSVLNPFAAYRKGEVLLRRQLGALSAWHLVNIVRAHELSDLAPAVLNALTADDLIELIVAAVRARTGESLTR